MTRRRKGGVVRLDYLQVPDSLLRTRTVALATMLSAAKGKPVSQGDALLLVCRLWEWVLDQVNESAADVKAEFAAKARVPRLQAEAIWPSALHWPASKGRELLQALADPLVAVTAMDRDYVTVLDLGERYTALAGKRAESRGRARASALAKQHGWKATQPGGGYVNPKTGEVAEGWRELLQVLETQ
jgi:hypothetical protein